MTMHRRRRLHADLARSRPRCSGCARARGWTMPTRRRRRLHADPARSRPRCSGCARARGWTMPTRRRRRLHADLARSRPRCSGCARAREWMMPTLRRRRLHADLARSRPRCSGCAGCSGRRSQRTERPLATARRRACGRRFAAGRAPLSRQPGATCRWFWVPFAPTPSFYRPRPGGRRYLGGWVASDFAPLGSGSKRSKRVNFIPRATEDTRVKHYWWPCKGVGSHACSSAGLLSFAQLLESRVCFLREVVYRAHSIPFANIYHCAILGPVLHILCKVYLGIPR